MTATTTNTAPPGAAELALRRLAPEAEAWPVKAEALKVVSAESYKAAAEMLLAVKALLAEADSTFNPIVEAAFKTHREALAARNKVAAPLKEAELILKTALATYEIAQERVRRAEIERREAELARQIEERIENQIAAAEAQGASVAEVAAIIQQAPTPPPVHVPPSVPKVAGIGTRENWRAEVIDLRQLVTFIAANPRYLNLVEPNQAALNGLARSLRTSMSIPGVRAVNQTTVSARRPS